MAEQQRQSLCPRLIDYLAIVGARSNTVPRPSASSNNASSNAPPAVQVSYLRILTVFDLDPTLTDILFRMNQLLRGASP